MGNWLPDTAIIVALVSAAVALYWNFHSAKAARKLPFLTKQLEYCFEASELAGKLASTSDWSEWCAAQNRLFELFWGPLAIVEDDDVARSMMGLGLALEGVSPGSLPAHNIQGPALDLSAQIRKLLLSSWKIDDLNLVLEDHKKP